MIDSLFLHSACKAKHVINLSDDITMATKKKVLVGCTGSVASVKIPKIVDHLKEDFELKVLPTKCSTHFFDPASLPDSVTVHTDQEEWQVHIHLINKHF